MATLGNEILELPSREMYEELLASVASAQRGFGELLSSTADRQRAAGSFHTTREICQQPITALNTAARLLPLRAASDDWLSPCPTLALTASGSSEYV